MMSPLSGALWSLAPYIPDAEEVWVFVSRFGEAQILLPAMLAALLWLALQPSSRLLAFNWLAAVLAATGLTTASKVAFIGFGIGYAPLDYTGISGHAMFSAAILPVLLRVPVAHAAPRRAAWASAIGYGLALLIAVSRIQVGAHSLVEVLLGNGLGLLASAWALRFAPPPGRRPPLWLPAALALWMALLPGTAPPSTTHGMVTALALELSGRPAPYTRSQMRHEYLQRMS
jgi:membrane-associated phospholipid phosphatase